MSKKALIARQGRMGTMRTTPRGARRACGPSDLQLDLRRLDPLPEVDTRRLLQLIRVHRVDLPKRRKVVAVLVRGDALVKRLFRDVIRAHMTRAAQRFDL